MITLQIMTFLRRFEKCLHQNMIQTTQCISMVSASKITHTYHDIALDHQNGCRKKVLLKYFCITHANTMYVCLFQRFTQYLASNNCSFNLSGFIDKTGVQGRTFTMLPARPTLTHSQPN